MRTAIIWRWCRAGLLAGAFTVLVLGLAFGVSRMVGYEWPTAGLPAGALFIFVYSMYRLLGNSLDDKQR